MSTVEDLAARVLSRLKVTGATETPDDGDLDVASRGVVSAHYAFDGDKLLRWSLSDIPPQVEEAYVNMGAYLCADDFVVQKDPVWPLVAIKMVQAHVHIRMEQPPYTADF